MPYFDWYLLLALMIADFFLIKNLLSNVVILLISKSYLYYYL